MSVMALDTHQMVKTLKASGFSEEQAEAVTQVVRDSQNMDLSNLATRIDIAEVRSEIAEVKSEIAAVKSNMASKTDLAEVRSEIAAFKASTRTELAETKVEIIKWVIGIAIAQAGFGVAMLRFIR